MFLSDHIQPLSWCKPTSPTYKSKRLLYKWLPAHNFFAIISIPGERVAYIDKVLFFTSFILIIFCLKVHLFIFIWLMTKKVNHFYQGRLLDRLMFTSQDEVFFIQWSHISSLSRAVIQTTQSSLLIILIQCSLPLLYSST